MISKNNSEIDRLAVTSVGMAVLAIVIGGFLILGWRFLEFYLVILLMLVLTILSVLALLTGNRARKRSSEKLSKRLSVIGIVLGSIVLIGVILSCLFFGYVAYRAVQWWGL